jgi:hypothetical protein
MRQYGSIAGEDGDVLVQAGSCRQALAGRLVQAGWLTRFRTDAFLPFLGQLPDIGGFGVVGLQAAGFAHVRDLLKKQRVLNGLANEVRPLPPGDGSNPVNRVERGLIKMD